MPPGLRGEICREWGWRYRPVAPISVGMMLIVKLAPALAVLALAVALVVMGQPAPLYV